MAKITQAISSLPVVEGRYGSDFIQQADAFLNTLPHWSPQLNQFAHQANNLRDEVNDFRNTTYDYMTTTKNYMNSTYVYKEDAINAANFIKNYVIPQEVTYSKDTLDSNYNSLLTAITATQVQISTITNFLPELADYKLRNVDSKYIKDKVIENLVLEREYNNGIVELFGGIKLQFGIVHSTTDDNGYMVLTFPYSFSLQCFQVICIDDGKEAVNYGVIEITKNTFKVICRNSDGNIRANSYTGCRFMAIGV